MTGTHSHYEMTKLLERLEAQLLDPRELATALTVLQSYAGLQGWVLGQLFQVGHLSRPNITSLQRWIRFPSGDEVPQRIIAELVGKYLASNP